MAWSSDNTRALLFLKNGGLDPQVQDAVILVQGF